jgi:cellulose synthase/poly-beta-1,6-N-acetylglucosamine synthase-like glycosyltransferase
VCWTEAPADLRTLRSQRVRWQHGLGDSLWINRGLLFKRGSGFVGWLATPFFLIFGWLGPLIEVAGYVFVLVAYLLGFLPSSAVLIFLLLAFGLGMLLAVTSLLLEEISFHTYPKVRHILLLLLAAFAENLGYRQLNDYWRLKAVVRWMLGRKAQWGVMTRSGSWQAETQGQKIGARGSAK